MSVSFGDAAECFKSFGAPLHPQLAVEWSGSFDLPGGVRDMYVQLGPDEVAVPAYGNEVIFSSLAGLWQLQAGYRFHGSLAKRFLIGRTGRSCCCPLTEATRSREIDLDGRHCAPWRMKLAVRPMRISLDDVVVGLGVTGSIVNQAGPDLWDDESIVLNRYLEQGVATFDRLVGTEMTRPLVHWRRGRRAECGL